MIDTLRYTKELQQAGLSAKQAESLVRCQADMMSQNVATKSDLKELEFSLRDEMRDMRSHFESEFRRIDERLSEFDGKFQQINEQFKQSDARFK